MTPAELRAFVAVHRGLAWVSIAALLAAVVLVWRGAAAAHEGRRAIGRWAVTGAALLGAATFVTGVILHGPFQSKLRQKLFLASATLGWLFERKEHAAFGAVALAFAAAFAAWAERAAGGRDGGEREARAWLVRACLLAAAAALVLEGLAAGVSIAVSGRVGF